VRLRASVIDKRNPFPDLNRKYLSFFFVVCEKPVVEYLFKHTGRKEHRMTAGNTILALYGRISDKGRQGDNFSIPTQLQMMREQAGNQGWTVYAELTEKDSAFINGLERSELNKVLDMARQGKINALMFFSPDRFTRDMADGVILRRELKRYGVRLFCYYPTFHEILSDMEVLHILTDWQSQKESERRRDNSMRGLEEKIRLGLYPQGKAPYGYRVVGRKHNTRLEIVEAEVKVVRDIFTWYYYHNIGCSDIARRLNALKIPSNGDGKGGGWTMRRVQKILATEAYAGTWYAHTWYRATKTNMKKRPEAGRRPITVPAIISRSLFESVKEKRRTRQHGKLGNPYLMSCRIRCNCGKAMGGVPVMNNIRIPYFYYRCVSNRLPMGQGNCGTKQWRVDAVDETVWQFAYELLHNPEKLMQGYRDMQDAGQEEQELYTRQIESLTEQITEQRAMLEDMIQQRASSRSKSVQAILDEQIEKYGAALDELEERREMLAQRQETVLLTDEDIAEITEEIAAVRKMITALEVINEEADFSAKKRLIEIMNLRATLRTDEQGQRWVDIHWLRKTEPRPLHVQTALSAGR
jgi:site-specific DNA recombinase